MRSRTLILLAVAGVAALAATSYATDPYPWGFGGQTSSGLVTYPQAADSGATDVTWYFPDGTVARQATTTDSALTVTWYWTYPDGPILDQHGSTYIVVQGPRVS